MLSLCASALLAVPGPAEPTPIQSTLRSVTVYPGSALVTRAAQLPAGDGRYLLADLPLTLDAASVRVRMSGGELVALDARERDAAASDAGRVAELTAKLKQLEAQRAELDDRAQVQASLGTYLSNLIQGAGKAPQDRQAPVFNTSIEWGQQYDWLTAKLSENADARRALARELDANGRELTAIRAEIGQYDARGAQRRRELVLDVLGTSGQPIALELDYLVPNAGWTPQYDLRADADLASVELTYRARIWQQTGEDWRECAIELSTAQPQRGAQGPEPHTTWLWIEEPRAPAELSAMREEQAANSLGRSVSAKSEPQAAAGALDRPAAQAQRAVFASVDAQGLSLRYQLARKETVESRMEPTQVLVGRAKLGISAERHCAPALDTSVWLRGRAKNDSEWVLLPGSASVYFGADYVGPASIETVQRGEEFTLHLGSDPNWKIERTKLADTRAQGGLFSSRQSERERWKLSAQNLGSPGAAADGSVVLIVREALAKSGDARIEVVLDDPKPKPSDVPRWKKDREEQGILTWELKVARGQTATLEWGSIASWPEGLQLARN